MKSTTGTCVWCKLKNDLNKIILTTSLLHHNTVPSATLWSLSTGYQLAFEFIFTFQSGPGSWLAAVQPQILRQFSTEWTEALCSDPPLCTSTPPSVCELHMCVTGIKWFTATVQKIRPCPPCSSCGFNSTLCPFTACLSLSLPISCRLFSCSIKNKGTKASKISKKIKTYKIRPPAESLTSSQNLIPVTHKTQIIHMDSNHYLSLRRRQKLRYLHTAEPLNIIPLTLLRDLATVSTHPTSFLLTSFQQQWPSPVTLMQHNLKQVNHFISRPSHTVSNAKVKTLSCPITQRKINSHVVGETSNTSSIYLSFHHCGSLYKNPTGFFFQITADSMTVTGWAETGSAGCDLSLTQQYFTLNWGQSCRGLHMHFSLPVFIPLSLLNHPSPCLLQFPTRSPSLSLHPSQSCCILVGLTSVLMGQIHHSELNFSGSSETTWFILLRPHCGAGQL